MTIDEKIIEIEKIYGYWLSDYSRRELTLNNARIVCESVCKAIILKIKMEAVGTSIILGRVQENNIGTPGQALNLSELISVNNSLQQFRHQDQIKLQMEIIRYRGNPGSHSANAEHDKITPGDLDIAHLALSQILTWCFEKLRRPMPETIVQGIAGNLDAATVLTNEPWQEFLAECSNFDKRFQFLLVAAHNLSDDQTVTTALARMPWRLVLDFDPDSDEKSSGLLYNFDKIIGMEYRKVFTIEDRPDFDPKYPHYWFMANGQGSVAPIADNKQWRTRYGKYLSDPLYKAFNKGSLIKSRVIVMLNMPANQASAIVAAFNLIDEANIRFVLCHPTESYDYIFENFDNAVKLNISPEMVARGVENSIQFSQIGAPTGEILIPVRDEHKQKRFIPVERGHYDYLVSLGIELVSKDIDKIAQGPNGQDDFYKGALIDWNDLRQERDIPRNCQENLVKRVRSELEKNRLQEIEFVHEAGAGGTTVGRRLAFDFSEEFPTVVLRKYEPKKTIAGLRVIYDSYTKGSLPLLIVTEAYEIKDTRSLHRDLANASKNAVIFVIRRGAQQSVKDTRYFLRSQLELDEAARFTNRFADLVTVRAQKVRAIVQENRFTPDYVSPFLFGLVTYDGDFRGVDQYVEKSLVNATLEQKKLIGFISLIYHFSQRGVSAELFTTLLGVDRGSCDLVDLLGVDNPLFDLLHEEYDRDQPLNIWRPRYAMLGKETLKIIVSGSVDHKENWKTGLGVWLVDLIKYMKEAMPYLDEETEMILNALFIDRIENTAEEQNKEIFTDLVKLLQPNEGELIFQALTDAYPDVAHFHGHFARYLYHPKIGIRNYDKAIEEAEYSLEIQTHDSTLVHTLGMCYREKAEHLINTNLHDSVLAGEIEEEVKDLVDQACEEFDRCIDLEHNTVYGHESQIRIILKALDFGFRAHSATSKEVFISTPQNDWYSKKLDKVGVLLEEALFVIDQATGLENKKKLMRSAGYIQDCEGNFLRTLGRSIAAKDKFESLAVNTPAGYQYMRPHFRRMFVMCLLASKTEGRDIFSSWSKISNAELEKCVRFLSDNIFEDSPNPQNIRLWLQAVRHSQIAISLEDCLSRVSSWTQMPDQTSNTLLEGYYYLYVLNAIKAISRGSGFDPSNVQNVKELKEKMKGFVKNEKHCFEWYGAGDGIRQMVNHKVLGDYGSEFFERNAQLLKRVNGRIKEVTSSQHGTLALECGLEAFFVPGVNSYTEKNKNDRVTCYIGFRYDQIQAWQVQLVDVKKIEAAAQVSTSSATLPPFATSNIPDRITDVVDVKRRYTGKISYLDSERFNGYVDCSDLQHPILFNRKHLTNCKFNRIKPGMTVELELRATGQSPMMDDAEKCFLAATVRAKFN